jgi:ribonuclease E
MKRMLINATQKPKTFWRRLATPPSVDGQNLLSLLDYEDRGIEGREQRKGNIYKAVVDEQRVEPGPGSLLRRLRRRPPRLPAVQGNFPPVLCRRASRPARPHQDVIKEGQELLVQVEKEERGNKGAALTTFISAWPAAMWC